MSTPIARSELLLFQSYFLPFHGPTLPWFARWLLADSRSPPSNVDLAEYGLHHPTGPIPQPKPLKEPTTGTFLILRRQLSAIIGRIVHHFQKLNEPAQYADVQRLQEELDGFTQNLPPHFRMKDADKSLDKREFTFVQQRRRTA